MNLFDAGLRERPPDVTNWSLVRAAGSERDTLALPAREILYRQYAPAVYGWARSRGHSVEDAQDLTQSFFEHLISTDWFQKASASKGRFRAYMMTTLRNYAAQGARRSSAKKRGAGQSILPIHLEEVIAKVDALNFTGTSPEYAFHRGWALAVMDETLKRLKEKYEASGQGEVFRILSPWIGAVRSEMTGKYAAAASELGLKESAARTAVHRLREAYRSVLWLRVAEYLHTEDPGAIREELASLAEAC